MPIARSLVTNYSTGDLSRDKCTNVVYHSIGTGLIDPAVDWTNHANEVLQAFVGGTDDTGFLAYNDRIVEVRTYDMADAEPRPEKSFVSVDNTSSGVQHGPPELAAVLSFYAGRNIPGLRSHIFIGPLKMSYIGEGGAGGRPHSDVMTMVLGLGNALYNIGGSNVGHVIRNPKATKSGHAAGDTHKVTEYSVSDSWGSVHSRNLRPTTRVTHTP
jgi:hypothetical protein